MLRKVAQTIRNLSGPFQAMSLEQHPGLSRVTRLLCAQNEAASRPITWLYAGASQTARQARASAGTSRHYALTTKVKVAARSFRLLSAVGASKKRHMLGN